MAWLSINGDRALHIRPATIKDCADLAILEDIASHGMASWLWSCMARATGRSSVLEVARAEVRGEEPGLSYKSAVIAESDDMIAGAVIAYLLDDRNAPGDEDMIEPVRRIVVPLVELVELASGAWYINVLATYPEFRGQGVGAALLDHAARAGSEAGAREISLIAEDDNPAIQLYRRAGFIERERRPFVPFETSTKRDGDWVLMVWPL